jgi:hypothetical protein
MREKDKNVQFLSAKYDKMKKFLLKKQEGIIRIRRRGGTVIWLWEFGRRRNINRRKVVVEGEEGNVGGRKENISKFKKEWMKV